MKEKIKNWLFIIFGIKENIFLTIVITCFGSALFFAIISYIYAQTLNSTDMNFFGLASSVTFSMWIILAYGGDGFKNFMHELIRFVVFFFLFGVSIIICGNFYSYNGISRYLLGGLACFIIVVFIFYLITKLSGIFKLTLKVFNLIKYRLFNSIPSATTRLAATVENITVFLVSIIGLLVAMNTIINTAFQMLNDIIK